MIRAIVGDFRGQVIGELDLDVEFINWRLNQYGLARFSIPVTDPMATQRYLNFGNRILFEFGNGLPSWGGVIDPPRIWRGNTIRMTAYSGEYLLSFRHTDRGRYFTRESVGAIFAALLNEANSSYPTGVSLGPIWEGGALHSPEYHLKDLYSIFNKSLTDRLSSADWDVKPVLSGGVISFQASLYDRLGRDKSDKLALIEGFNITEEDLDLTEQGPIINRWTMAGAGTGWGDDRPIVSAEDLESRNRHGLRSGSGIQPDIVEVESLTQSCETELARSAWPRTMIGLSAVDKLPARFSQYGLGDSLALELYSFGFQGGGRGYKTTVKVIGREYIPGNEVTQLVVEEE